MQFFPEWLHRFSQYHRAADEDGNLTALVSSSNEGCLLEYLVGLTNEGVDVRTMNYPYGHDWVLWRKLIVKVFDDILWK